VSTPSWVNLLITGASGFLGALVGGLMSLWGTRIKLKADRDAEERAKQNEIESAIFRGALSLDGNTATATGMIREAQYATEKDGTPYRRPLDDPSARMLAQKASALVDPLHPVDGLGLASIPLEYWDTVKHLARASQSVH